MFLERPPAVKNTQIFFCCQCFHFLIVDPNFRRKRSSELFELYDNETIYSRAKRYVEEPKFDVFLNPSKREKQEETLKNLTKKFQNVFSSMDMQGSYPALFQVFFVIRGITTSKNHHDKLGP